jgi:LmbE family N-acetylglucosaminyl deacetylase
VEDLEGQLLVLSPHFDDAVLSYGELFGCLPGTVVATVCSGIPGPGVPASPEWDAPTTGCSLADQAARCRTEEDRRALTILGATQRGLGLVDELYRRPENRHEAGRAGKAALQALLDELRPRTVVFPIGLGAQGSDHDLAQEIAVAALESRDGATGSPTRSFPTFSGTPSGSRSGSPCSGPLGRSQGQRFPVRRREMRCGVTPPSFHGSRGGRR